MASFRGANIFRGGAHGNNGSAYHSVATTTLLAPADGGLVALRLRDVRRGRVAVERFIRRPEQVEPDDPRLPHEPAPALRLPNSGSTKWYVSDRCHFRDSTLVWSGRRLDGLPSLVAGGARGRPDRWISEGRSGVPR